MVMNRPGVYTQTNQPKLIYILTLFGRDGIQEVVMDSPSIPENIRYS